MNTDFTPNCRTILNKLMGAIQQLPYLEDAFTFQSILSELLEGKLPVDKEEKVSYLIQERRLLIQLAQVFHTENMVIVLKSI